MNYSWSPRDLGPPHIGNRHQGDLLSCLPPRRRGSHRPVPLAAAAEGPGRRDRASRRGGGTAVIPASEGPLPRQRRTPAAPEKDPPRGAAGSGARCCASTAQRGRRNRPRSPAPLSREFGAAPPAAVGPGERGPGGGGRSALPARGRGEGDAGWERCPRPCVSPRRWPAGQQGPNHGFVPQCPRLASAGWATAVLKRPEVQGGRSCAAASLRLLVLLLAWAVRGEQTLSFCYV